MFLVSFRQLGYDSGKISILRQEISSDKIRRLKQNQARPRKIAQFWVHDFACVLNVRELDAADLPEAIVQQRLDSWRTLR